MGEKKEKKTVKKPAAKKEKTKVVPFDQIDIKTATDDEIIKSGLLKQTTADYICYAIMAAILVLAFLPPFLRLTMPRPITEEERDIHYVTLSCYKSVIAHGYELSSTISANYREDLPQDMNIVFYVIPKENAEPNYTFQEVEIFSQKTVDGFSKEKVDNKYTFNLDFENKADSINQDEMLKEYGYVFGAESQYLGNAGYYCSTTQKVERERVYVSNGKKVE